VARRIVLVWWWVGTNLNVDLTVGNVRRDRSAAGRIVNVASMSGHLSILESQSRRDAFTDPALTK